MLWTMGGGGGKAKSETGVKREREWSRPRESGAERKGRARKRKLRLVQSPAFFRLFLLLSSSRLLADDPSRFSVVALTNEIPG